MSDPVLDSLFAVLAGREAHDVRDWAELLDVARQHGVEALFAQRVMSGAIAVPAEIEAALRAIQTDTVQRNTRRLRDFATAARALHERGIPVIALKGMQLVPLVYRNLAARTMIDLDLLVPAAQLAEAADAIRSIGYAPKSEFRVAAGEAQPYFTHHLPPFLQSGVSTIELHWHVHSPRRTAAIALDELWERATSVRLGPVDAKVLAIEDLLLHVAEHATYGHRCEVSARACCDVAEIVRQQDVDWSAVVERAQRWNIAAGTYLMLRMTRERLGAAIPDHVLAALAPADFDERLLDIALRGDAHKHTARRLRYRRGAREKLRAVRELLFIGRDELADLYRVRRSSPVVFGLYFVRAARLLKRLPEVAREFRGDRTAADEAALVDSFLGGAAR